MTKKEKQEEEERIKAKWTGRDEKTGAVTPKDYDEIVKESVRIAKEEADKLFVQRYNEAKAKEAEEVKVKTEAQKTEAYQLNHNLLLSEGAVANAKPNLEIFADDVKASHGATFAQVDGLGIAEAADGSAKVESA